MIAIRLYSTAAFMSLNNPLRDRTRTTAHPFAATVFFLADGIKKLRAVEADREAEGRDADGGGEGGGESIDLWRGMRNLQTAEDFLREGGSETALMYAYAKPMGRPSPLPWHTPSPRTW